MILDKIKDNVKYYNINGIKIIQNIIKHIKEIINLTEIVDRSISVDKSKSIKSYKSFKKRDTLSLKRFSQFNNNNINKIKNFPIKIMNFKEDKKGEKENSLDSYKNKIPSFKNVRISFISKKK